MEEKDIKENMEGFKEQEEATPYQITIEEKRKELYKAYSTQKRISYILRFVILIAIVGVMVLIMNNSQTLKIIGYVGAGLLIVGMIVYYLVNRKGLPVKAKEYMAYVVETLRNRQFSDLYENVQYNPEERFAVADFVGDGVYKDAVSAKSRNIVRAEFKGHHITYGEVALFRSAQKRQQVPPVFVGKYIAMPNTLEFEGRYVIVYKSPKQPYDLPNNVDDLVVLEEKDDLVVYGPKGGDFRKALGGSFISDVRRLELDNHLFNVNIAVWAGHSAAYLSYDDAVMSIPLEHPFDYAGFEQSVKDVNAIIKLLTGE